MAQSVHWNAELLNKPITRVNAIVAAAKLASAETKSHHEGANDLSIVRDKKLRDELDVTIKALQVDFERLEKAAAPVQPTSVPDLGRANERFEQLQQQVAEGAARLAESTEHLQAQLGSSVVRLDALEHASKLVYSETTSSFPWLKKTVCRLLESVHGSGANGLTT